MEPLSVLVAVGLIHCSLLFFDRIFKSCSHYPYIKLLKHTGLKVQILRVQWFTTAFNRKIIKWGQNHSRFWIAWFNAGAIISIILMPIAIIVILKWTFDIWITENATRSTGDTRSSANGSRFSLEPMFPGIGMPFNDFGYYMITLTFCFIVHEFGHALAAVREDVHLFGAGILLVFIVPTAYVNISSQQLASLPLWNQLRIVCAGIWHNIILAVLAAAVLVASAWLWAPFYTAGYGVYVKTILPNSAVTGPRGLVKSDVIYELNNCPINDSDDWYYCILHAVRHPTPGYCVKQSFIQEYDESVPSRQKNNEGVNCCTSESKLGGSLCFEYIEGSQAAPLHLPLHSCLPARIMINQSQHFCQTSSECSSPDTHCMRPSFDNITKIVQVKRKVGKDVLYAGHPGDFYKSVDVSNWIPKYTFLHPIIPESLALLCKYIIIFSIGIVITNVVPCFFLDGQYIINILAFYLLNIISCNRNIRQIVTFTITSVCTMLLGLNMVYILANKLL